MIVIAIQEIQEYLTKRYDTRFNEQEAINKKISDLIKDESNSIQTPRGSMMDRDYDMDDNRNHASELETVFSKFKKTWHQIAKPVLARYES